MLRVGLKFAKSLPTCMPALDDFVPKVCGRLLLELCVVLGVSVGGTGASLAPSRSGALGDLPRQACHDIGHTGCSNC